MKILIFACIILWGSFSNARLTDHFVNWLENNGYGDYDFQRDDIGGESFGGKTDDGDVVIHQPIIFVHGNGGRASSFDPNVEYFRDMAYYKDSEMYATTWGIPGIQHFFLNHHKKEYLIHIRKFMEAVLNYTSAEKIDVIGHSLGVTMSRGALRGGEFWDNGTYDLGPPLTPWIDTYIGVAGLNLGFNECAQLNQPLCNRETGLYPGVMVGIDVVNRSKYLDDLNKDPGFEGDYRYSIYSLFDDIIGNGDLVYCKLTSILPNCTDGFAFNDTTYTHKKVLIDTADLQLSLFQTHVGISRENLITN